MQRGRLGLLQSLRQSRQIVYTRPPPSDLQTRRYKHRAHVTNSRPTYSRLGLHSHRPWRHGPGQLQAPHVLHQMRHLPLPHPALAVPLPLLLMRQPGSWYLPGRLRYLHRMLHQARRHITTHQR